jgi:hypothetical protein
MANTIDATNFNIPVYSNLLQRLLDRRLVARKIASFRIQPGAFKGSKYYRTRYQDVIVDDYEKYTDVTFNDIDGTQEFIETNQSKQSSFRMDVLEGYQSNPAFKLEKEYAMRSSVALQRDLDGALFDEVVNAQYTLDDGDIGGTDGNPIAISTTNIPKVYPTAEAILGEGDVSDPLFTAVSPQVLSYITQTAFTNGFNIADSTFKNGMLGADLFGFRMLRTNNLRHTGSILIATNPSANETVTVNGVTFKFVASPSAAGDVDIGTDAATSVDNLVAAINGDDGAGTAYIEVSAENRIKLTRNRVTATDNTTSIGVSASGRLTLAHTLTASADGTSDVVCHSLTGVAGCIDAVMRREITTEIRQEAKQLVDNFITHMLYGIKTFTDGAEKMINVQWKAQDSDIEA